MPSDLTRRAEGFDGIVDRRGDPPIADRRLVRRDGFADIRACWHGRVALTSYRQPAQRQPLRIQRGVIIGRLAKDFIRLCDGFVDLPPPTLQVPNPILGSFN